MDLERPAGTDNDPADQAAPTQGDCPRPVRVRGRVVFVLALGAWLLLSTSTITVLTWPNPRVRATIGMGWGLILLWIALGGSLMFAFRERIRAAAGSVPIGWKTRFVLFATVLALIEEAITTTMTNLAPLFGVRIGEAYITASTNYLDVVGLHSVIVFVPLFVGWAVILSRYDFSPFAVFLLFGLTGTLAEMSFGWQHLLEFGLWIFVYGLMIYLPAYCVPRDRGARPVRWWQYPLAVFVPFLFLPIIPLPLIAGLFFPNHPKIHFPPLAP